jgi:5-methylthioadenosine/S-adenosylhomocysteine deaminase
MLDAGVTVGIGTDGPASNNDLDMFEEMRLAALLAKAQTYNPTALPARQALLMATRQGAKALHLDHRLGSLEPGKLADLIVVDAGALHNNPHFDFNPEAVYSQLVYATKSTDVRDVMVNGRWLMRDRALLTVQPDALLAEAAGYAERIGAFVATHQGDVLRKLLAISVGLERSESFEVQVKAVLQDPSVVEDLFDHPDVELLKATHYRQHDTYFLFDDRRKGRVRYREDDKLNEKGEMYEVRARLTYTSIDKEREFNSTVLLSHSRFIASADRPLRFYQEYFQADEQRVLRKERRRYRIHYQGVLFYINVDRVLEPALPQTFIEIKARTWSATDAEIKADRIQEMLDILGITPADILKVHYVDLPEMLDRMAQGVAAKDGAS